MHRAGFRVQGSGFRRLPAPATFLQAHVSQLVEAGIDVALAHGAAWQPFLTAALQPLCVRLDRVLPQPCFNPET